jgi:hypothetical protein
MALMDKPIVPTIGRRNQDFTGIAAAFKPQYSPI